MANRIIRWFCLECGADGKLGVPGVLTLDELLKPIADAHRSHERCQGCKSVGQEQIKCQ